jgi:hypothetical protein
MNTARSKVLVRFWLRRSIGPMLWLGLLAFPCSGQFSNQNNGQIGNQRQTRGAPTTDMDQPMSSEMGGDQVYREKRLQQLNAAQHKSMVADTDKLLKLVTELNTEIENTNPNSLTPQQLRKIAEIEKLAHNVKDKMRMSVRGSTDSMESAPVPRMGPR